MLERISQVQGIGLLHDVNGNAHPLRKATLIYGDNGRGKSTLATILRSLSIGDASLIAARKTLDGTLQPKVILQFGSGHPVNFDAGAWSEQRSEVLVFDANFIERNVHSGGADTYHDSACQLRLPRRTETPGRWRRHRAYALRESAKKWTGRPGVSTRIEKTQPESG
jgi:energy-coupling factor transporter ATP-binding protein EcfA2